MIFNPCPILFGLSNQGNRMGVAFCTYLRLFRRLRYRWRNYIKTDLKDLYWEDVDWIHVAELGICGHKYEIQSP
jgi:hypothetical protein